MEILFVLIPLSLLLVALATAAFVWAARDGQFDADAGAADRVLHDDDASAP